MSTILSNPVKLEIIQQRVVRLCNLYLIETRNSDGTYSPAHRFTDHSFEIEYEGQTYSPIHGMEASAHEQSTNLGEDNTDFAGPVNVAGISEAELQAGRYDDGKVTVYRVDWKFPWLGFVKRSIYWLGALSHDDETWGAEGLGLVSLLSESVGLVAARGCEFRVGDEKCQVDLAAFTFTGEVTGITQNRREFTIDVTGEDDALFRGGEITFTSATNTGLVGHVEEVFTYDGTTGVVKLRLPLPYAVTVGDQISIVAGCDGRWATCTGTFDNGARFGGERFIPGGDRASETPDV